MAPNKRERSPTSPSGQPTKRRAYNVDPQTTRPDSFTPRSQHTPQSESVHVSKSHKDASSIGVTNKLTPPFSPTRSPNPSSVPITSPPRSSADGTPPPPHDHKEKRAAHTGRTLNETPKLLPSPASDTSCLPHIAGGHTARDEPPTSTTPATDGDLTISEGEAHTKAILQTSGPPHDSATPGPSDADDDDSPPHFAKAPSQTLREFVEHVARTASNLTAWSASTLEATEGAAVDEECVSDFADFADQQLDWFALGDRDYDTDAAEAKVFDTTVYRQSEARRRGLFRKSLLQGARERGITRGKWILFSTDNSMTITHLKKLATELVSRGHDNDIEAWWNGETKTGAIEIWTPDIDDEDTIWDVAKCIELIRMGKAARYKPEAFSVLGLSHGNEWNIKVSLFASSEVRRVGTNMKRSRRRG